jgi:hypothetical protein
MVFYVRDPGAGFRRESLTHAAIANPTDDPVAHIVQREAAGMRPGGYGVLLASGTVDELIYNEIGNEVSAGQVLGFRVGWPIGPRSA